jgi:hypothetical protein
VDAREVLAYLTTKQMCLDQQGRGIAPGTLRRYAGGGVSVKPQKGMGVLFYSRLPRYAVCTVYCCVHGQK